MKAILETLESRRLLAGHGFDPGARLLGKAEGVDDPAVQASVALVQADQAGIAAAKEAIRTDATDTRDALKTIKQNAVDQIGDARQAVKDAVASGDPAAIDAARAARKALRQQIRADITAARQAVREDTADGRTALKDALTSLRDHLKQLRTDLQNAGVLPTRNAPTPAPPENGATAGDNANQPPTGPVDTNVPNPNGDQPNQPPTGPVDTGIPNPNGDNPNQPPTGPVDTGIPNPNGDNPGQPPTGPVDTGIPNPNGDNPNQPPTGPVDTGIPNPNGDNPGQPPTGPVDTGIPNPNGDNPNQPPTGPVDTGIPNPNGDQPDQPPSGPVDTGIPNPNGDNPNQPPTGPVDTGIPNPNGDQPDQPPSGPVDTGIPNPDGDHPDQPPTGPGDTGVANPDGDQPTGTSADLALAEAASLFAAPAERVPVSITLTPEDAQAAADKIREVAATFTTIDQAAVDTLAMALVDAAADGTITPEERRALCGDAIAVIRSIDFAQENVRDLARQIHEILRPALHAPPPDIALTPEDAQAAADKIQEVAATFTTIDQGAVDTLADNLVAAAADSTLTPEERRELTDDAVAVIRSIDFAEEDVRAIAREIHEILGLPPFGRPRLGPPPLFAR